MAGSASEWKAQLLLFLNMSFWSALIGGHRKFFNNEKWAFIHTRLRTPDIRDHQKTWLFAGYQVWDQLLYICVEAYESAQNRPCKNKHISMHVHTQCWWGSSYILSSYLWKHDLRSLNYESGQMLCLKTPHYTHSLLSHIFENDGHSFSQEWLTFRETERKSRWGAESWGRDRQPTFWQMNHWSKWRSDSKNWKRQELEETNTTVWPGAKPGLSHHENKGITRLPFSIK